MGTKMDVRPHTGFDGRYLGLTTFKRDGTGVTTPVWFVREAGRLLVETDPESYKVKRIRREPTVSVTLCTARGRLLEIPVPAHAEILPDDEVPRVEELMARKYRVGHADLQAAPRDPAGPAHRPVPREDDHPGHHPPT